VILVDVNILLYTHREDADRHAEYRDWIEKTLAGEGIAVSGLVLSGFIRIATHPRVFDPPSPLDVVIEFAQTIRRHNNVTLVEPGARHWDLFHKLLQDGNCRGNLVPDAYLAALAIETGCELATTDRDFARFPGLRWRHPFQI
jgi:toxin-antitoxin system PIN domain toxin